VTTPDLAAVPASAWRDHLDLDEAGAGPGAALMTPAQAGIHLGTGRDGRPVSLPAPGPAGTRIAVLGEALFGRLMALRLLAAGAQVSADTRVPEEWQWIRRAAGDGLSLTDEPGAWPARRPAPPGLGAGPQALISDRRRPPPAAAAAGAWRTVLHVTRTAPRRVGFWSDPDALLALDASHAEAVGHLLGGEAARHTAQLAQGEIILFRPTATEVLRPDIAPGETALLTPAA
jgi:hypothetical protein